MTLTEKNAVVLFQGDSITDAGRNREDGNDLGRGYAFMTAAWFRANHPDLDVTFLNRGIGGNTIRDLDARWDADCLQLKPTWLSVLVGINDAAGRYHHNRPIPVEEFEKTYWNLLQKAVECSVKGIILIEPFVLPTDPTRVQWREDLDPKIEAVRRLAREFQAHLIPADGLFAQSSVQPSLEYWMPDGVHPTPAGHALLAQEWLKAVGA